jgi:hypothetical protein
MAQKVSVVLEDDLTGGPAEQTIRFAFDGTGYEIDLNAKNAAKFSKQLAPTLSTPAGPAGHSLAGVAGPRSTGSARVISGLGRKSTAFRSVSAGASPPPWPSSTTRPADPSTATNPWMMPEPRRAPGTAATAAVRPNVLSCAAVR